jgi:hypothetical protein
LVGKPNKKDRYKDFHDELDHLFQDYNDYEYIDNLKGCYGKDWLQMNKVGKVKD